MHTPTCAHKAMIRLNKKPFSVTHRDEAMAKVTTQKEKEVEHEAGESYIIV